MTRRVTVYEVAQRAGVSIATVSFAFTRPEKIKASTAERVLAAADELGYVPSASARGLASGRTGAIGLYAYDYVLEPPTGRSDLDIAQASRLFPLYVDEVQRGVQLESRRRGLALLIGGSRPTANIPDIVEAAGRVDGLIVFAGALSVSHLEQAVARIPVVELGGEVRAEGVRTVLANNGRGMAVLVEHLLGTHGHRRFAYFGELGTEEFRDRHRAFTAALEAASLPVPEVRRSHAGDDSTTEVSISELIAEGDLPDAIVCDTDQSALVAIDALRRAGLEVPRDVAVTGFDGIVAGQLSSPALTTVRQPMTRVGETAVALLASALDGPPSSPPETELRSDFLLGASCGCGAA